MSTDTPRKPRGRPRSFDRDAALERAVLTFWEHGYEATSVADLTRALGIGAPSLYAAFGDKQALFEQVLAAYAQQYGLFIPRALEAEPTAREGVARMLREAAAEYTCPGRPHGCMVIHAAVNCTNMDVVHLLRDMRESNIADIRRRVEADVASGALPADTDAPALARFAGAVLQGMSQQSRDGASRAELEAVAAAAMAGWPAREGRDPAAP